MPHQVDVVGGNDELAAVFSHHIPLCVQPRYGRKCSCVSEYVEDVFLIRMRCDHADSPQGEKAVHARAYSIVYRCLFVLDVRGVDTDGEGGFA